MLSLRPLASLRALLSLRAAAVIVPVAYVAVAMVKVGTVGLATQAAVLAVATVLALSAASDASRGARVDDAPWLVSRVALAAATLALLAPDSDRLAAVVRASAGLAACVASGLVALRVRGAAGLAPVTPVPTKALTLVLVALWGYVLLARARAWLDLGPGGPSDAVSIVAMVSLATLLAIAVWTGRARRLELGATTRAHVMGALFAVALAAASIAAAAGARQWEHASVLALALAAASASRTVTTVPIAALARHSRRVAAFALLVVPLVSVGAAIAHESHRAAAPALAVSVVLALLAGASAATLEQPLLPDHGALLHAVERAKRAVLAGTPLDAPAIVLSELRALAPPDAPSPTLWAFAPTRVLSVDAAGYLREQSAELPPGLVDAVASEPSAILRREVLEALEVRRPDLRPLLRWMERCDAWVVVEVTRGDEVDALLVVPDGGRRAALSPEEADALLALATTLAFALESRGAVLRSLAREVELESRIAERDEALARAEHAARLHRARTDGATLLAARGAPSASYSPSMRLALEAIAARYATATSFAVVAESGTDAAAVLARAHLAGPRSGAPFMVVDGASFAEGTGAAGAAARGQLDLAQGGVLVLVDAPLLPAGVQRDIAIALADRARGDAEPVDVVVVATATADLVARGHALDPALAERLAASAPIELPTLSERGEDMRALLVARLAREGLRTRGAPVGIDAAAVMLLVEHPFEGGDAELDALCIRLVRHLEGDVVRPALVRALLAVDAPADSARPAVPLS